MSWLIKLLVNTLAVFLVAQFQWIPGIQVENLGTAFLAALILGLINLVIRPLILLLTLPLNIATLGLFTFVINALLFWLTGYFVEGFEVGGFVPAFLGALLLTVLSWIMNAILD
ncbi:phage holin family protein [Paenactinomyces guangxiensis]|uniref:Phage holin family protein n=1 Tax=Paenactinomyces guangxiensis TaxID=1490290 RepID=A0A7W1WSL2_9BACL|nr:phage holin family protein [Paenactinomyces guangxiensis]MBA4495312.1 phage holin family protein [Paenactinomyces guangxiensis]MBH8592566.1 phage holin family protein [Paenactinomyces guangxiensis]